MRRSVVTSEVGERIREMAETMTVGGISTALGIPYFPIWDYCRRHGIAPKPQRRTTDHYRPEKVAELKELIADENYQAAACDEIAGRLSKLIAGGK